MDDSLDSAVFVALGCNDKGDHADCEAALEAALAAMSAQTAAVGLRLTARSSWWRSAAWPDPSDPPFVNGVVRLDGAPGADGPGPSDLMALLAGVEAAFGRRRARPNAPRTLDLDLIAHGRLAGVFDGVIVPHPRAAHRLFVMGPLAEIAPDWTHPLLGETAATLAQAATVGLDARPVAGEG